MDKKQQEIKLAYEQLQKKHQTLPSFTDMDNEIEFVDFLSQRDSIPIHLESNLRRRLVDVVGSWINYLHNFVMPNQQSMILVHEAENVSEEERDDILMLINQLMFMNRQSAQLELKRSQEEDIKFIVTTYNKWLTMKETMLKITNNNVKIWEKAIGKKIKEEKTHYFG